MIFLVWGKYKAKVRAGAGSEGYQKIIHLGFHCWLRSAGSIVWAGHWTRGVDIDNAGRRYDRCDCNHRGVRYCHHPTAPGIITIVQHTGRPGPRYLDIYCDISTSHTQLMSAYTHTQTHITTLQSSNSVISQNSVHLREDWEGSSGLGSCSVWENELPR